MKPRRLLLMMTFVVAAGGAAVYASGTAKSEQEKMKKYSPGSSPAFSWVAVNEGLVEMQRVKMPGMIYYYNPNDNVTAYMWEMKVFDCAGFKSLKDTFIIMMIDSSGKAKDAKVKIPKDKTGVIFLDYTGKKIKDISRVASPSLFGRMCSEAAKRNAEVKKEEGDKKETPEKKQETEKKENTEKKKDTEKKESEEK